MAPLGHRHATRQRCRKSRCRPPCRPASSVRSPASPTSGTGSRSCFATRRSFRAPWCWTRRSPCTPPNGYGCRPASARSITTSRASALARPTPMPTHRHCTGWRCCVAVCRGSRPTPVILRPASTARSARGCRWGHSPAACRWAPATVSAMCCVRCSTSRTATSHASCYRR